MKSEMVQRLTNGDEVALTIEREMVDVRTSVQPTKIDPDWTWTDPKGHVHDASLKKAKWVVWNVYWCEDCWDEHEESRLQCIYCGAEIEPRRIPDYSQPDSIPGLTTARMQVRRGQLVSTYLLRDEIVWPLTEEWIAAHELQENLLEVNLEGGL